MQDIKQTKFLATVCRAVWCLERHGVCCLFVHEGFQCAVCGGTVVHHLCDEGGGECEIGHCCGVLSGGTLGEGKHLARDEGESEWRGVVELGAEGGAEDQSGRIVAWAVNEDVVHRV